MGTELISKRGTAEVLTGIVDLTSYGTPGASAPIVFEGYSSAAGDGGIGEVDGNAGNHSIWGGGKSHVIWKNMILGNTGTAAVITPGTYGEVINCKVHNATGNGINLSSLGNVAAGCWVTDISANGIDVSAGNGFAFGNFLSNGTKDFSIAINLAASHGAQGNVLSVDGSTIAIQTSYYPRIIGNSILASAGTGIGIYSSGDTFGWGGAVINNIVEGFSGVGGDGILRASGDSRMVSHNAAYNNTTNYSLGDIHAGEENETLSASAFAKTGSIPTDFTDADFWADLWAYFALRDEGNVRLGYPGGCGFKGAVAPAAGAGSKPYIIGG